MIMVEAVEVWALQPVSKNDDKVEGKVLAQGKVDVGRVSGTLVFHHSQFEVGAEESRIA